MNETTVAVKAALLAALKGVIPFQLIPSRLTKCTCPISSTNLRIRVRRNGQAYILSDEMGLDEMGINPIKNRYGRETKCYEGDKRLSDMIVLVLGCQRASH